MLILLMNNLGANNKLKRSTSMINAYMQKIYVQLFFWKRVIGYLKHNLPHFLVVSEVLFWADQLVKGYPEGT